jgi:hypothetical protein
MYRLQLSASVLLIGLATTACSATASAPQSSTAASSSTVPGTPKATLGCRLPVAFSDAGSGFVSFPPGTYTPDAESEIVAEGALIRTRAQPVLHGQNGGFTGETISYDHPEGRWLPVASTLVSPDGIKYAYTEFLPGSSAAGGATRVHLVDVASAIDRVVYDQGNYQTVHFAKEGIYLLSDSGELWRLDPATRAIVRLTSMRLGWGWVTADAAWALNGSNYVYGSPGVTDRVVRLDLKDGSLSDWFDAPGAALSILGFDGRGLPVVISQQNGAQKVVLVARANSGTVLLTGSLGVTAIHDAMGDDRGIWLATDAGIYVALSGSTMQKASSGVSGPALRVAGSCL